MSRKNRYSPSEWIKTAYSAVLTKLTFPQARLIRRPLYCRGKKSIAGGNNLTTGRFCRFDLESTKLTLFIGDNCEFGDNTHIVALNEVRIGNDVLIASKVFISDCSHGNYNSSVGHVSPPSEKPNRRKLIKGKTTIGNNVWIGENAVVLMGASIEDGCVIGANAVVSGHVPANSIVVGNNRIIRQWDESNQDWERV